MTEEEWKQRRAEQKAEYRARRKVDVSKVLPRTSLGTRSTARVTVQLLESTAGCRVVKVRLYSSACFRLCIVSL